MSPASATGDLTCPSCGWMRALTFQEWSAHPTRCGAAIERKCGGGANMLAAVCDQRTIARLNETIARVHEIAERAIVRGENNSATLVGGVSDMVAISRLTDPTRCPRF